MQELMWQVDVGSVVLCVTDCLSVLVDARVLLLLTLTVILRLISLDVAGMM